MSKWLGQDTRSLEEVVGVKALGRTKTDESEYFCGS